MKKLLLIGSLCLTVTAFTQKTAKPDGYAKSITAADLKKHLYIVAGPEMEGREAATEGERKAAAYIENEFKRVGLEPGNNGSYRMYFPIYQDSLLQSSLEINGVKYELDKDYNLSVSNPASTLAFNQLVFLGPNVPADTIRNMDLAGRLVVVSGTMQGRNEILRSKGAAAVFSVMGNYPRAKPSTPPVPLFPALVP